MLLLLLLACTGTPTGDAVTPDAPALTRVRVALNWFPEPEFGGFYDALVRGTYRDAGLDVTLIPGGPGTPVLELLAAGNAEVAVSGAEDLLVRRAQGLDAVAVFPGFQDSPVGLLVHEPGGPTRYEDVAGVPDVKVAIEAGSAFQQYTWAKFGWEGKVPMVPTTGSLGAFAADPKLVQQAYVTSEPCVAESQGLAVGFLPARDAGWNPYASLAVVRGADTAAPWVAAFTAASKAGWEHYLVDPAAANAEIAKLNPDMAGERAACVTERQKPFVTGADGLGVMTAARWGEVAAALEGVGQKTKLDGAWLDTAPNQAGPGAAN